MVILLKDLGADYIKNIYLGILKIVAFTAPSNFWFHSTLLGKYFLPDMFCDMF